jgi:hypothetical protein
MNTRSNATLKLSAFAAMARPSSVIRNRNGRVAASNTRFCTLRNSISSTLSNSSRFRGWNTTTLSKRFMNSGEKLRLAASTAVLSTFSCIQLSVCRSAGRIPFLLAPDPRSGCCRVSRSEKSLFATSPLAGCHPVSASLCPISLTATAIARHSPSQSRRTTENSVSCDRGGLHPTLLAL